MNGGCDLMVEWFTLIGFVTTILLVFLSVAKLIEFIFDKIVYK